MIEHAFGLWETPIAVLRPPGAAALNHRLRDLLVAEAAAGAGLRASNGGGTWHSVPDLALREQPPFPELGRSIVAGVRAVFERLAAGRGLVAGPLAIDLQAWAMVTPAGGYVVPHDHTDQADFSVAWYVDPGDADLARFPESGRLVFQDPRRVPRSVGGLELHPPQLEITPDAGMVVVFPGWVSHWVHPYRGTRPRVVVSANLRFEAR